MSELKVHQRLIAELKPRVGNPRTHSLKQLQQIARSIEAFGFTNPVLIDREDGIIAGHGRIEAAKLLGITRVPAICLETMSEAQVRAYVIADNRLAENAGWDRELLAIEFEYLNGLEIDFDVSVTGFELPQIDILLTELEDARRPSEAAEEAIAVPDGPAITRAGDVWIIGEHRLVCGDALASRTYEQLLQGEKAQLIFTDPPYNVPIAGHVVGLGKIQHREFAMAAGEMSKPEFTAFLASVFHNLVAFSADGSLHYVCMDWRHMAEVLDAAQGRCTELKNLCVWAKTNGGMGSLYRSQHELVFVYKAGTARHINNVELGRHGRNRTNLWIYPGVNTFGSSRSDLELHPTVKPVELVADAIRDGSHRGNIVLDAFAGSGSTIVAAQQTGRKACGIELDALYCDVIIRRMAALFGIEARLEGSDLTFEQAGMSRVLPAEEQAA